MALRSYVNGSWVSPTAEGTPLLDAVTGEQIDTISSAGIDMRQALDYGRTTGGPNLRDLTFHQRAAMLKALGLYLREHRPELYALSARSGATLNDAKFDVDGGIGVLASYASKGRRELPDGAVLVDGTVPSEREGEPLGRGGQFLGQHILTPRHGVAVQVNAFNFPVWGPLEKFAPAFLAGVPSLVKPASATAYLTARLVELIVDSQLLPAGTLQLICGSTGDLLDHLTDQDLLSFTGSASTAARLRTHPAVVARSVRFNAEADSLNCSILGPDATPGSKEFDLYVKQLVTEMTVKAGQKCTAIRRALVPGQMLGAVADAAAERLAKITIGNPADESVRMGALASLDQREEVRRSLKALLQAGTTVFGDPYHVEVRGADPERGAFISPVLIRADDASRAEPHEVEAFGPVSTLIGYRDTGHAIELAARGLGSLAGSVVTGDAGFARDIVLGIAPWHGRLLVLDTDDAAEFDRARVAAPGPRARRPGPGGRRRGTRRHPQRRPPHAAHRRPGEPARCLQKSPAAGCRAASARPASTRSASRCPS